MFETLFAPGWFGKLPTVGDFASRRLPQDLVDWWDSWLSLGLAQLRERHAEQWQALFLAAPAWRYVLAPGVAPGATGRYAWAGVLIPSVDCVGRYYPLSLLAPISRWPLNAEAGVELGRWLARLEDLAADALHDDWSIERLELALDSEPQRLAPAHDSGGDPAQESIHFPVEALASMGMAGRRLFAEHRPGRTLWQRGCSTDGAWQLVEGLPAAQTLFEAWT